MATRTYGKYAAVFLLVTVVSGSWLRGSFVLPTALGPFGFTPALHAHSHLALFGWTTMALFALLGRGADAGRAARLHVHAHLVGIASAAAFVGFLLVGYRGETIVIATLHVVLWYGFIGMVWRLPWAPWVASPFARGALVLLGVAGAGAMAPGIALAFGNTDAWVGQIAIQAFLTPFIGGWLTLGAMGTAYAALGPEDGRGRRVALWLTLLGVLPSALLHTTMAPPHEWLTWVGRMGAAATGVAALAFGRDIVRRGGRGGRSARAGPDPLLGLAGMAALAKGGAELAIAAGIGLELAGARPMVIAYLHLVLLGIVTPVLASRLLRADGGVGVGIYAGGLTAMLGALAALAIPPIARALAVGGITAPVLYWIAFVGALLIAAGAFAFVLGADRARGDAAQIQRATRTSTPIAAKSSAR